MAKSRRQSNETVDSKQPKLETVYIKDIQPNNTAAQAATVGSYAAVRLNTVENPLNHNWISLAANQITLQPGTYEFFSLVPMQIATTTIGLFKTKLRNITNSSDTLIGTLVSGNNPGAVGTVSARTANVLGSFTISAATVFELQHRASAAINLGSPANFSENEVYAQIKITKVG